jgi:uncharacterized protein with FMN-binding domain
VNPKKRVTNNLLALGSAAVIAVYAAGYVRTQSAAELFAGEDAERRPARAPRGAAVVPTAAPTNTPVSPAPGGAAAVHAPGDSARAPAAHAAPAPQAKPKAAAVTAAHHTDSASAAATPAVPTASAPVTAPASAPAPARDSSGTGGTAQVADSAAQPADKERAMYKDGTYTGWGTSRHGDIQAAVEIKGGRISNAYITLCLTRYSCSWIAALPPQVVVRQSPEVDFVSGATQSTNAFYYAVVEALSKAK